ncbi:MAG: NAD(P)H-dependent oxidoreductase subunit E [Dehalococcoidales bacterium]|nr:NAD(P)H-dependent oxidoreductase subunit E [Dehalococcoidales bacterium]
MSVKYTIRLCSTPACHKTYRGEDFIRIVEEVLGIKPREISPDGKFHLEIVDCMGMCFHAPSMMVNDERYQDLTAEQVRTILTGLKQS